MSLARLPDNAGIYAPDTCGLQRLIALYAGIWPMIVAIVDQLWGTAFGAVIGCVAHNNRAFAFGRAKQRAREQPWCRADQLGA